MAKKEAVKGIFNDIAPKYDLLNHFLSANRDKSWRRKAIQSIAGSPKELLLDVACGTGDLAIVASQFGVKKVIGVDISDNMINIGNRKIKEKGRDQQISLMNGDCEQLCFDDNHFDAVTVAFGVRNFEHLEKGLSEMHRVLKPGGKVVILEFSMPEHFPVRQLYKFYFRSILPLAGGLISGNKGAYTYLPESVMKFPQGQEFLSILEKCGFSNVARQKMTFGIVSLYTGSK